MVLLLKSSETCVVDPFTKTNYNYQIFHPIFGGKNKYNYHLLDYNKVPDKLIRIIKRKQKSPNLNK